MRGTFFGHKNTSDSMKEDLKKAITAFIENEGVMKFYVGNNGNFDFLVQRTLAEIQKEGKDIEFYIVLSFVNESPLIPLQSVTIFPEGLEFVPPKYAISKRNEWMIQNSDFALVYVENAISNSKRWMKRAEAKGLKVKNLAK